MPSYHPEPLALPRAHALRDQLATVGLDAWLMPTLRGAVVLYARPESGDELLCDVSDMSPSLCTVDGAVLPRSVASTVADADVCAPTVVPHRLTS